MVLYGPDSKPELYQANALETNRVLATAGMTSLISLEADGQLAPYRALVREIQRDVLTDALLHVDLYRVSMTQKITTEVPLEFIGESSLVVQMEAILLTLMDRVEIECLPGDLVSSLAVDLTPLQTMEDVLLVKDIPVPEGITILAEGEEVVARLTFASREEEEEEEELEELPLEFAADEVEVISKGKAEEEEGEDEE
jgi:large subunit ribosomal protein L25